MKHKISISLDREIVEKLDENLKSSTFRNKSHLIELAIEKFLKK